MSLEDINRRLIELEELGLVEKTGELQNGRLVWAATARSKHLVVPMPGSLRLAPAPPPKLRAPSA